MSDYKEFTGRTLDEAIREACDHFQLERSRLELEILSGGSSGIFGLVGKKKAVVRARPLDAVSLIADASNERRRAQTRMERQAAQNMAEARPQPAAKAPSREQKARPASGKPASAGPASGKPADGKPANGKPANGRPANGGPKVVCGCGGDCQGDCQMVFLGYHAPQPDPDDYGPDEDDDFRQPAALRDFGPDPVGPAGMDDMPDMDDPVHSGDEPPMAEGDEDLPLDDPELEALLLQATRLMVQPILGEADISVVRAADRIKVRVSGGDDPALFIGRDGQTLAAAQYLLNRVVGKRWPDALRVQIETGDYRERQDERLRKLAQVLADKARTTGKVQSTRPLSSYHRRVVHLALQENQTVTTRSKGEGPLKRVLVLPRRGRNG